MTKRRLLVLGVAVWMAGANGAWAQTKIWSGGTGEWHEGANWTPSGVPDASDTVAITNGSVLLTNATTIASLVISNATLTFTNWETCLTVAGDVVVTNNGLITHAPNSDTNWVDGWQQNERVWIVCTNLTVTGSGRIDVSGCGFRAGKSTDGYVGKGPGGDPWPWASWDRLHNGIGASHGGKGGTAYKAPSGPVYGSATAPTNHGSGGGTRGTDGGSGHGGGTIRLEVTGTARIENGGQILANGNAGGVWSAGGGAGGSIWLTCNELAGNGLIAANAGASGTSGYTPGSGGGRIALEYNTWNRQGTNTAWYGWGNASFGPGDPGTLYVSGTQVFAKVISGHAFRYVGNMTNWEPEGLVLSNALLWLDITNLKVHVKGDLKLINSELRLIGGEGNTVMDFLTVDQDLILTNNSRLVLFSGVTNEPPEGAEVVRVGRDMVVATNCTVYPVSWFSLRRYPELGIRASPTANHGTFYDPTIPYPPSNTAAATNGGSVRFEIARNLIVAAGGAIDATACGYAGGFYDMSPYSQYNGPTRLGYGPGANQTTLYISAGAGHGGTGGKGYYGDGGGPAYGSSNAPIRPGSGGARGANDWYDSRAGQGGGLVRVSVGREARIDGSILADGSSAYGNGGGGSGGGIWITCRAFSGAGTIRAKGGDASSVRTTGGGGGAGGRIAIWRTYDQWTGDLSYPDSVLGGTNYYGSSTPGATGTVFFYDIPPAGTMISIE